MAAFFIFVGAIWRLLLHETHENLESGTPRSFLSSSPFLLICVSVLSFAYCVFSYFYIWTTAVAFLGCIGIVWLVERPEAWKRDIKNLAIVGAGCVLSLIPYAYLLSKRTDTMDHVQLLVRTHAPDFFRFPEYVAFAVMVLLITGLASKVIDLKGRSTLFVLSLALVPFVIFNQQVITGQSLQPIHYQVFIGNYVAALAFFSMIGIVFKKRFTVGGLGPKAAGVLLMIAAIFWGFVECHYTVRVLDEANIERDQTLLVANRLSELAKADPDPHRTTVLSFNGIFGDDMPSVAPQNILWARHQHVFAGLSWEESKERYYQQLYYQNVDERGLDYLLKNDFVSQIALFGWGRHTDRLSAESKPLTYGEIAVEVAKYKSYRDNFSAVQASNPTISYVVVPNDSHFDLSKVEEWYELDEGEEIGGQTLFKAKLK